MILLVGALNNLVGSENQNHNNSPSSTTHFIFVEVRSFFLLEKKLFNWNEVVAQRYVVQESDTTMLNRITEVGTKKIER